MVTKFKRGDQVRILDVTKGIHDQNALRGHTGDIFTVIDNPESHYFTIRLPGYGVLGVWNDNAELVSNIAQNPSMQTNKTGWVVGDDSKMSELPRPTRKQKDSNTKVFVGRKYKGVHLTLGNLTDKKLSVDLNESEVDDLIVMLEYYKLKMNLDNAAKSKAD
jgi:hypothetical protein